MSERWMRDKKNCFINWATCENYGIWWLYCIITSKCIFYNKCTPVLFGDGRNCS